MFSGGEKKSFYKLSVLVIDAGIIALELKINRFTSKKILYLSVSSIFLRSRQLEVRFFLSEVYVSSWRVRQTEKGNGDGLQILSASKR